MLNIEEHRHQDRAAEDDIEREGVDADEGEAVVQHAEDQRADQAADHGAGAARQRRPADHARRHGEKHDLIAAGLRIDRADPKRLRDNR